MLKRYVALVMLVAAFSVMLPAARHPWRVILDAAAVTPTPTGTPAAGLDKGQLYGNTNTGLFTLHMPNAQPSTNNLLYSRDGVDASNTPYSTRWLSLGTGLSITSDVLNVAGGGVLPINPHTLSGATPVAAVTSATIPTVDVENLVLSANVTSFTMPAAAAMADGEIIQVDIKQSASGGPFTLPSATIGPFTAGSGTALAAPSGVTCPTIGTTQSAATPSELIAGMRYVAALTELQVVYCNTIR